MRMVRFLLGITAAILLSQPAVARNAPPDVCARPAAGSNLSEPEDLRSRNGLLRVDLAFHRSIDAQGHTRYCYLIADGSQAPTLRLSPGDLLILKLRNDVGPESGRAQPAAHVMAVDMSVACANGSMLADSTNLHFHGLYVPPVCHQDDVLKTVVGPSDPPFEYRFQIPRNQPPGLYWYHPHVHGFSNMQVQGGASGALIVEGIERANPQLAGLAERILIVRDQELINPDAAAVQVNSMPAPVVLRDPEGDILNTGTGEGKPARDLSLNFIPVAYPKYEPAVIATRPSERQFWRVLNASAITYVDLQLLVKNAPQLLGVVALDGVPIEDNGLGGQKVLWESHLAIPPGGRVEFMMTGPALGEPATLVTRAVDTGPAGENDPTRPLATVIASGDAPEPVSVLPPATASAVSVSSVSLEKVKPVRVRRLYFSEEPQNPKDPNSPTAFFITEEGKTPKVFDPHSTVPDITVQQGDVEDWIIENRSQELHAFHIHQIHFMLVEFNGVPVDEPYLRDIVNVAYWDGKSPIYPNVRLRMDFRDPNVVGTSVYHCHLLEHEDGGMMGTIQVLPAASAAWSSPPVICGTRAFQAGASRESDAASGFSGIVLLESAFLWLVGYYVILRLGVVKDSSNVFVTKVTERGASDFTFRSCELNNSRLSCLRYGKLG